MPPRPSSPSTPALSPSTSSRHSGSSNASSIASSIYLTDDLPMPTPAAAPAAKLLKRSPVDNNSATPGVADDVASSRNTLRRKRKPQMPIVLDDNEFVFVDEDQTEMLPSPRERPSQADARPEPPLDPCLPLTSSISSPLPQPPTGQMLPPAGTTTTTTLARPHPTRNHSFSKRHASFDTPREVPMPPSSNAPPAVSPAALSHPEPTAMDFPGTWAHKRSSPTRQKPPKRQGLEQARMDSDVTTKPESPPTTTTMGGSPTTARPIPTTARSHSPLSFPDTLHASQQNLQPSASPSSHSSSVSPSRSGYDSGYDRGYGPSSSSTSSSGQSARASPGNNYRPGEENATATNSVAVPGAVASGNDVYGPSLRGSTSSLPLPFSHAEPFASLGRSIRPLNTINSPSPSSTATAVPMLGAATSPLPSSSTRLADAPSHPMTSSASEALVADPPTAIPKRYRPPSASAGASAFPPPEIPQIHTPLHPPAVPFLPSNKYRPTSSASASASVSGEASEVEPGSPKSSLTRALSRRTNPATISEPEALQQERTIEGVVQSLAQLGSTHVEPDPQAEDQMAADVEVHTRDDCYVLVTNLPGFRRDAITVAMRKKRTLHLVADSWGPGGGHFERRVSFGYDADMTRVRAEFDGEKLTITVPRRPLPYLMGGPFVGDATSGAVAGNGKDQPPWRKNYAGADMGAS